MTDQPDPAGAVPVATDPAATTDAAPGPAAPLPQAASAPGPAAPLPGVDGEPRRARRLGLRRFVAAFFFGAMGVLAVSAGGLAAFESSNNGRIMPGVHVGAVDLSGMSPDEARASLNEAYAGLSLGELTLDADGTTRVVPYASIGRRLDVDAVVEQAMAVGRSGATLERIAANVRNMVRGVEIAPVATFERIDLRLELDALAVAVEVVPVDATVALAGEEYVISESVDGRSADVETALVAAAERLVDIAAPAGTRIAVPVVVFEPAITTEEATAARDAALRIAVDTQVVDGAESWTIPAASIRGWITFAATPDGGYGPVVAPEGLEAGLAEIADDVAVAPVDASFLVGDGDAIVGVTEAKNGRALDIPGMVTALTRVVEQRVDRQTVTMVSLRVAVVEPDFTTEEATQTAPLMELVSAWTTWFPIGIKNGQGANIWIPANDVDGYVVLPGEMFDFWEAIGPVTRERGYKDGGAIINGKTEPQGALAGGICSTSTTLFNAALRAGLEMGARRNHYYYIDRYPLGLDATVFQSSSGSVQTMSFRNDTEHPILIRGMGWREGTKGYVKFELWSVPNQRVVTFSNPIVKNVKPASDSVVYTTALAPGARERTEFPVDGKDVWVTRTVKDASGTVLHQETYYSHYARITGIVQIGVAPEPPPEPLPEPVP